MDGLAAVINANMRPGRRRLDTPSQHRPAPRAASPSTVDPLDGDFPVDEAAETPLFRLLRSRLTRSTD